MSRPAVATTCHKCGAATLTGYDGDVAAFTARVDAEPIGRDVELLCVIASRRVYDVDRERRIRYRRPAAVVHKASEAAVHAEHICGRVLPAAPRPIEVATFDLSAEPPF